MTRRIIAPLILLAVVLFLALSTGFEPWYRLAYILCLALVAGFAMAWLNLRWLSVKVDRRTSRTQVGNYFEEDISIINDGRFPKSWIEVEELTDLPGHSSGELFTLPKKERLRWEVEVPARKRWKVRTLCRKRGVFHVGPLRVTSRDPLGFFKLERYFLSEHKVVVYPAIAEVPGLSLPLAELPEDGKWYERTHRITPLASSVREYMYGDGVNRIHWPSTARLGKLMVKEFDAGLSSNVWIILDMDQNVQAGGAEETTDDLGATVAASVAHRFLLMGLPVGLISYGETRCFVPPDRGDLQLERLLERLALLMARGRVPLDRVIYEEERTFGRYDSLLIITSSSREEWVRPLEDLRRRNVALSAIVIDRSSFGGYSDPAPILEKLASQGIPNCLLKKGQPLSEAMLTALTTVDAGTARFVATGWQR